MCIDEIVREYIDVKATAAAAAKREKELKALLLDSMRNTETLETENYTVILKKTTSSRLDTDSLYRDFPDIKGTYGWTSVSTSIIAAAKQQEKKTA